MLLRPEEGATGGLTTLARSSKKGKGKTKTHHLLSYEFISCAIGCFRWMERKIKECTFCMGPWVWQEQSSKTETTFLVKEMKVAFTTGRCLKDSQVINITQASTVLSRHLNKFTSQATAWAQQQYISWPVSLRFDSCSSI